MDDRQRGGTSERTAVVAGHHVETIFDAARVQESSRMNIARLLAAGAFAGAAGTAAMDFTLYLRYRRDGGHDSVWSWEFAQEVTSWDRASAPGRLGQKIARVLARQNPPDAWARPTTNLVHWATGIGWGLQYGALASRVSGYELPRALGLGPAAWLASYVLLPLANIYRPIWTYDAPTLGDDLTAHLVYGMTASAVFAALTR